VPEVQWDGTAVGATVASAASAAAGASAAGATATVAGEKTVVVLSAVA